MSTDTTYNGWKNYETWNCKLWMDNDSGSCDYWAERAQDCVQRAIDGQGNPYADDIRDAAAMLLADEIENETSEGADSLTGVTGMYSDLLSAALGRIDYREIADSILSDVEIYSAGWNMPGCLPESDPAVFTDADDALEYVRESARTAVSDAFDGGQMTEQEAETAESEIDAWAADKNGEFGHTYRDYHYWVTKV